MGGWFAIWCGQEHIIIIIIICSVEVDSTGMNGVDQPPCTLDQPQVRLYVTASAWTCDRVLVTVLNLQLMCLLFI